MADLGVQGDGKGRALASRLELRGRRDGSGLPGGTGVRYLSFGLSVNAEASAMELLRLRPSTGISSTFTLCPGSKGQTVVEGCEGLWHSLSPSTSYCERQQCPPR